MVTADGQIIAEDAKVDLDDSSLFRHLDMVKFRDEID
jgi:succinyl-CoA synthetase beta subunit